MDDSTAQGETGGLMIGGANDPAEARAGTRAAHALSTARTLGRKGAAGEAGEKAQRSPTAGVVAPGAAPTRASKTAETAVNSLGPGHPLSPPERAFYEPRLGADLSAVRLHEDAAADTAARAMDASAFTLGKDIAFARGERAAGGGALLAHELAHAAEGAPAPVAQRTLRVQNAADPIPRPGGQGVEQTNRQTIQNYLDEICFPGAPQVAEDGLISPVGETCGMFRGRRGQGCECMCELIKSQHTWTIIVRDSPARRSNPRTHPDDPRAAIDPQSGGTGGQIYVPSPNSPVEFGYASTTGEIVVADPWQLLAHEMCGHARRANVGQQPPEDPAHLRHGHEATVEDTNRIRDEYIFRNIPHRGTRIQDPYCGESFSRRRGETEWEESRHLLRCWRQRVRYLRQMRREHPDDARFSPRFRLRDTLPLPAE